MGNEMKIYDASAEPQIESPKENKAVVEPQHVKYMLGLQLLNLILVIILLTK